MLLSYAGEWKHDVSVFLLQENGSCYIKALRRQSPATEEEKPVGNTQVGKLCVSSSSENTWGPSFFFKTLCRV